jgi:hypothetical protein
MGEDLRSNTVLGNMHGLFLEALRHREQEIFHYLAILAPALGAFGWVLFYRSGHEIEFICVTLVVIVFLLLGAIYSLALGYNYRYIVLELAKLEAVLKINNAMLQGWPRSRKVFLSRYKLLGCIPWCTPPEIIRVFWWAFIIMIGLVAIIAYNLSNHYRNWIFWCGLMSFLTSSIIFPVYYGFKFLNKCEKEPETWE